MKKQVQKQLGLNAKKSNPLPTRIRSIPKPSLSQPKNIKKPNPPAMPNHPLAPHPDKQKPAPTIPDIMKNLQAIDVQHLSFQQCWQKLITAVDNVIKLVALFPQPVNTVGEELVKNGNFILTWLKITEKNGFINTQMVYKNVREKYIPKITLQNQKLQKYINQKLPVELLRTPAKPTQAESLKRSILKSKTSLSQKKVQFGTNQVIYPVLNDYQPARRHKSAQKENRVKGVRQKKGFLLDYFQINQVYFLDEVELVGVIREYENTFAMILVRVRETNKEVICIGVIKNQPFEDKSIKLLQQIDRDYPDLAYLELDGKDTGEIWVDSLPIEQAR